MCPRKELLPGQAHQKAPDADPVPGAHRGGWLAGPAGDVHGRGDHPRHEPQPRSDAPERPRHALPQRGRSGRGQRYRDHGVAGSGSGAPRSEEHTSELQSRPHLVCRLLLEKKKKKKKKKYKKKEEKRKKKTKKKIKKK